MNINIFNDKVKRCYNKYYEWHNAYGPDETECDGEKTYYRNNMPIPQHDLKKIKRYNYDCFNS